jgi:hypothetical protein
MYVAIRDAFKAMRRQLQDLRMLPAPRCEGQRGTRESADCFRRKAMASSKPWMAARFTFTKTACSAGEQHPPGGQALTGEGTRRLSLKGDRLGYSSDQK